MAFDFLCFPKFLSCIGTAFIVRKGEIHTHISCLCGNLTPRETFQKRKQNQKLVTDTSLFSLLLVLPTASWAVRTRCMRYRSGQRRQPAALTSPGVPVWRVGGCRVVGSTSPSPAEPPQPCCSECGASSLPQSPSSAGQALPTVLPTVNHLWTLGQDTHCNAGTGRSLVIANNTHQHLNFVNI